MQWRSGGVEDYPDEELVRFCVYCRARDVVPGPPHKYGVRLSAAELARVGADELGEAERTWDAWVEWIAARVVWAEGNGGVWPVKKFACVGVDGREFEDPASPMPAQRPWCPPTRQPLSL